MTLDELLQLYFDRSNALQSYWTLYVVVIGGLLAVSALRSRPDVLAGMLVTILFICFAYKNLGAIHDAINQRQAMVDAITAMPPTTEEGSGGSQSRALLAPTLIRDDYTSTRTFHITCDVLTMITVWLMQARRYREAAKGAIAPAAV